MSRPPPSSTLFPYTTLFRSWSMVDPLPGAVNLTLTVRILDEDDEELATDTITRRYINDGLVLEPIEDRKSTRLNSSHSQISYAVFCLKKKKKQNRICWNKQ